MVVTDDDATDPAECLPRRPQSLIQEISLRALSMNVGKRVAQRPLADANRIAQSRDTDRVVEAAPQHLFGFDHDPLSRGNASAVSM